MSSTTRISGRSQVRRGTRAASARHDGSRAADAARRGRRPGSRGERGQSLVEFALVFPLFIYLVFATIEFGFLFSAVNQMNYVTRNAALIAAEAGNNQQADCFILRQVESDTTAPASPSRIREVRVFRANRDGSAIAANVYQRGGTIACQESDGTAFSVPYTASSSGYPPASRCNEVPRTLSDGSTVLPCRGMTPARTDVDTIGVQVTYAYQPKTPMSVPWLGMILRLQGSDYLLVVSNPMRMEPVL